MIWKNTTDQYWIATKILTPRVFCVIELQRPRVTEALLMRICQDRFRWMGSCQKLYPLATVKITSDNTKRRAKTIFLKSDSNY